MAVLHFILEGILEGIFYAAIRRLGVFFRWLFLFYRYSYKEVLDKEWNSFTGFLILTIGLLLFIKSGHHTASASVTTETSFPFKDGDIIFQTSASSQSKAIQLATHSVWSHCGIIYQINGKFYVYEAIQPVTLTPLQKWINRGNNGTYSVKRLKDAGRILTPQVLAKMKRVGETFKGKNYDLTFEWSDDRMYCSELIWKIYQRATGLEVGKLQHLRDFDLTSDAVQHIMKKRYGRQIPLNEKVISPSSIFNSSLLVTVGSK